MEKKKIIVISLIAIILILSIIGRFNTKDTEFEINTVLLKSVTKQGEPITNNIKITNKKDKKQTFQAEIKNLQNLVFLNENNFYINPNKEKNLEILFEDKTLSTPPGVYVGELIIKSSSEEKKIPIILETQSKKISFATNLDVAPEYKEITPGGQTSVEIKTFNLIDTKTHTVEVSYIIKNFNGDIIASETENIVVGTEASITKTITLPKDIPLGNYAFIAITRYKDSISSSSYLFKIVEKIPSSELNVNSFALLIIIFLFGIIGLVIYMIHDRNKLFLELRKYQLSELQYYTDKIKNQRKLSLAKAKTKPERKKLIKKYKEIKKKIIKKIKKKHKKQNLEFKKIKKKQEMKQKLGQWERQGFNVDEFYIKTKKLTRKDMKKQIKDWKKSGFNTNIFQK